MPYATKKTHTGSIVVVSSYGGLRGFCGFSLHPSSIWFKGAALGDVGATALRHVFLCGDVTSGLPDDVIIDAHTDGSRTDGHFRVTSDVMGRDVTSG